MIVIETERLILRHLTPDDLDDLAALYADPEVMRFWPRPYTRAETQVRLEEAMAHEAEHGFGLWATLRKPEGRFIGRCGLLRQVIDGVDETEVAYMLARSEWGQGLASEAARGITGYAFGTLQLRRLIALIVPENTASVRVAESIGMRFERDYVHKGQLHRVYSTERQVRPVKPVKRDARQRGAEQESE